MAGETTGGPIHTSAIRVPRNAWEFGVWFSGWAGGVCGRTSRRTHADNPGTDFSLSPFL